MIWDCSLLQMQMRDPEIPRSCAREQHELSLNGGRPLRLAQMQATKKRRRQRGRGQAIDGSSAVCGQFLP